MSGYWEIQTAVSPVGMLIDAAEERLVRVRISDLDSADLSTVAFVDLPSTEARRIALEILAAADDADWQTEQNGCPQEAR